MDHPEPTTHEVQVHGAQAYAAPDPAQRRDVRLDPGLRVTEVEQRGGWSHVRCTNGWECWVVSADLSPLTGWSPTHRVPSAGLDAHPLPGAGSTGHRLDPALDVEVVEWSGAWAHVRCSNGWRCWVDGRELEPHA